MSKLIFIQPPSHSSEQQHTKVAFFVELQVMTMCDSAPGLGKVGCLPFWASPWEYFYPFGLPLPTCSDSIRKSLLGWKWSKLTRVNAQKCEEQVLLDVKLEKDHLSCAWVTSGSDGTCVLRHFCYKPEPRLSIPGDWCHARGGCASAVGRALPLDHTAATLQNNSCVA